MSCHWINIVCPWKAAPPKANAPEPKPKTKVEEALEKYDEYPVRERLANTVAVGFTAGSLATLAFLKFHSRFLRRYPTHEWITPDLYSKKRWIKGIVKRVGDPDGFRLYHTPVSAWFWKIWYFLGVSKGETISVRLAGIDAPEYGFFGNEEQPYAQEALDWLEDMILGKVVHCQLLMRDRFGRTVAAVMLPRGIRGRLFLAPIYGTPIIDEMLRAGWAKTYIKSCAVYGKGGLDNLLAIEAEAKKRKCGQWVNGTNIETPSEDKKRTRAASAKPDIEKGDIDAAAVEDSAEAEKGKGSKS